MEMIEFSQVFSNVLPISLPAVSSLSNAPTLPEPMLVDAPIAINTPIMAVPNSDLMKIIGITCLIVAIVLVIVHTRKKSQFSKL